MSSRVRRFECIAGTSSKYWEVQVNGRAVVVRFGRIGAAGQTHNKSFAVEASATQHTEKLIREKTAKGYREAV